MPATFISGDVGHHDPEVLSQVFKKHHITRIDTAARYQDGESEKIIGRSSLPKDFLIDTKILLSDLNAATLAPDAIDASLTNSLRALNLSRVHTLYCHGPDLITPIADQARALTAHYHQGRFRHLGVSNFSTAMLREWLAVADREGYITPTYFQGQYNLLCRSHEETLFPLLRERRIHYAAYSPLAGGFLLGNFTADGVRAGRRFALRTPFTGWYGHASMYEAVERLRGIADRSGVGMEELALRWLVHHSELREGDVVILGTCSRLGQFEANLDKGRRGPLGEDVAGELSRLWEGVRADGMSITDTTKW